MVASLDSLSWLIDILGWCALILGGLVALIALVYSIGKVLEYIFDKIVGKYRLTYEFLYFLQHKSEIKKYICKTVSKEDKDFLNTKQ